MDPLPEQECFELGYRDYLQPPLRPFMDNLEAQTYETFEKDTVKYIQYQRVVAKALVGKVLDENASTVTTVFTFTHPNLSSKSSNERYKNLHFEISSDTGSALIHGFGGYFDATLYKDVHLDTEPSTATPNMFSWMGMSRIHGRDGYARRWSSLGRVVSQQLVHKLFD